MNLHQTENTIKIEDLVIYRTQKESKTYRSKILNKTFRFVRHKVIEYVNIKTGEIIPYALAKQIGVTEFDYEPLTEERNEILNSFRKEVKDFACFVLIFRNKRRGLSPNIEQVTEYYSKFSGMRKNNIKTRLLPPLMNKVLHSSTLMMPPFQINDKKATAREHLQEDFIAENKFFDLMFKKAFRAEEV